MNLGLAIHKALDFFFCDRCPFECSFYKDGSDCQIWLLFGEKVCPFVHWWDFLPEEPFDHNHPIRWPRSWLGKATCDEGKQNDGGVRE